MFMFALYLFHYTTVLPYDIAETHDATPGKTSPKKQFFYGTVDFFCDP